MVSPLECYLSRFRGERVLYAPNPGNGGDALIAYATYRLFEKLGIRHELLRLDCSTSRTRGEIVLYGGGGNLVELYSDARNFIALHHGGAGSFIVLPHTVLGHADLLRELGSNVTVICRESASLRYVQRYAAGAESLLMDDVAFGIDALDLLRCATATYWPARTSPDYFWRQAPGIRSWLRNMAASIGADGVLDAFRTDNERTGIEIPENNIDVSLAFETENLSPRKSMEASWRMLWFLNGFARIRTNRLHVCIAALLLGKPVDFFDNSYGKNRLVYESSMRGRFPRLTWHGASAA